MGVQGTEPYLSCGTYQSLGLPGLEAGGKMEKIPKRLTLPIPQSSHLQDGNNIFN